MTALRRARAAANLLHRPPGGTPESIVRHLLAVQSQDMTQGRRALRARGSGFTAADVDDAIVRERSIVVAWFNRGTLFMVGREDHPWLLGLTAPVHFTASRTRLGRLGIGPDQAERMAAAMEAELAGSGPLSRAALRERLVARGVAAEGNLLYNLLFHSAGRGRVVVGPLVDGRPGVALTRDWLGREPPPVPLEGDARDRALAELARRYLASHGPATDRDLAWWAGLPLRDARRGLSAIKPPAAPEPPERIPLRLLPMWDAYLLGWPKRDFMIPAPHAKRVFNEGMIGPAVAVDGRLAGTWRARGPEVGVEPFGRVPKRELDAELSDLARFEAWTGEIG